MNVLNDFLQTYPGPYPLYNDRGGALSALRNFRGAHAHAFDSQGYIQQVGRVL